MMAKEQFIPNRSIMMDDVRYRTLFTKKYAERKPYTPPNPKLVKAFIPGTIISIFVKEGARVMPGDKLLVLEAMKMKNIIIAQIEGVIKTIFVKEGNSVPNKATLIELE